jgi:hypothetical protein
MRIVFFVLVTFWCLSGYAGDKEVTATSRAEVQAELDAAQVKQDVIKQQRETAHEQSGDSSTTGRGGFSTALSFSEKMSDAAGNSVDTASDVAPLSSGQDNSNSNSSGM